AFALAPGPRSVMTMLGLSTSVALSAVDRSRPGCGPANVSRKTKVAGLGCCWARAGSIRVKRTDTELKICRRMEAPVCFVEFGRWRIFRIRRDDKPLRGSGLSQKVTFYPS